MKSHWSCWTVFWHKIVLIIQSRFYFCRQNILFALNFEKRILEHIDVNIDHICHFQSIDLQVYFLPKIILVKLISSVKTRQIWGIWKLRLAYSPETPNLGQNRWCFVPCDLEIWRMTLENDRASLLHCFKLCATFHSHWWIQTGVTVRKRPFRVKFDDY